MASFHCWIAILLVLLADYLTDAKEERINLSGSGCDRPNGYYIGDDDMATIYHQVPRQTISTRDDCWVTVNTEKGHRLEYIISVSKFLQCGVKIYIYDSAGSNTNPKHVLDCKSGNQVVKSMTNYNVLRLHLRKTNVDTDNFDFLMKIINDRGPPIDTRIDADNNLEKDPLEPGIIVGIAIAGVIIIICLVLLAIYLCFRARQANVKDPESASHADSNVYTSGSSKHIFANKQYSKKRYGSTEDVRSTTSSQEKTNGAYSNTAYTSHSVEKKSDRTNSVGRAKGKAGFTNDSFQGDEQDLRYGNRSVDYSDDFEVRIGSFRKSRIDSFKSEKKQMKSTMKKQPTDIEMSKVNTQPNSILKKSRTKSPNRSQTSTEGSVDANAIMYGYNRSAQNHPNVRTNPVLERRRSRSGTRSNRSASSGGHSSHRRTHSADRKQPPKPKPGTNSRMYGEVFIDESKKRPRSNSRSRARSGSLRSRSNRGSDSIDSESSYTSSRRVNMNPGGKRVQIAGKESDF